MSSQLKGMSILFADTEVIDYGIVDRFRTAAGYSCWLESSFWTHHTFPGMLSMCSRTAPWVNLYIHETRYVQETIASDLALRTQVVTPALMPGHDQTAAIVSPPTTGTASSRCFEPGK